MRATSLRRFSCTMPWLGFGPAALLLSPYFGHHILHLFAGLSR
jgi:hypothetical protein